MKRKQIGLILILLLTVGLSVFPVVHGADAYSWGVTKLNSTAAQFWFQPSGWSAGYVILHYTVAGQTQQNVYTTYDVSKAHWLYNVTNLTSGKNIRYSFTYSRSGRQYDSGIASYTVGAASTNSGTGSNASPSPSPIVHGADAYSWGVTKLNSTAAQFWFQSSGWSAGYVILHYTVAGQTQQNVYTSYNGSKACWLYNVANLTSGKNIRYSFTYSRSGRQYDSGIASYTVGAASTNSDTNVSPSPSPSASASSGYMYNSLVWSDEFTGSSLKRSNWNYQIGNGYNSGSGAFDGWGNGEWEWYRESNVSVTGGNLVIKGEYNSTPYVFASRNWYQFSGRITTKGLQSWKYARVEARIKLPTIASTWPAFWMMGDNCDTTVNGAAGGYDKLPTNWASCGEIDIMEHKNAERQICSNLFWDTRIGLYPWAGDTNANNPTWTSGVDVSQYHVYAMEWNATTLKYYLDGKVIKTQDISASSQEEFHNRNWFVILNLAISGSFTGPAIPNQSDFPCYMYVDYVRVYQ